MSIKFEIDEQIVTGYCGNTYADYLDLAKKHGLSKFSKGARVPDRTKAKIVTCCIMLGSLEAYGILCEGKHYIVGIGALKKVYVIDKGEDLIGKEFYRGGKCVYVFKNFDEDYKKLQITYDKDNNVDSLNVEYCRNKIKDGKWTFKETETNSLNVSLSDKGSFAENSLTDFKELDDLKKFDGTYLVSADPFIKPNKKENTMSNQNTVNVKVPTTPYAETTVITMYGNVVDQKSEQELFRLLDKIEDEQLELKRISKSAKSTRITAKIAALGSARNKVVVMLDALPEE